MLLYEQKLGSQKYELIQSTFDAQFKLNLMVDNKILPAGNYVIMIAPEWNQSTNLDAEYFNVRVGIYAPDAVSLRKCN